MSSSSVVYLLLTLISLTLPSTCLPSESSSTATENTHVATNGLPFPWSKLRLPNYIIPVHYHLLIHPNLTTLRFNGSVKIEIDVKNNTNWVVLHSKNLEITAATVLDESEANLFDKALPVLDYPPHEQIAIFSPTILTSGEKYFLYLEFSASLNDGFFGFYKSSYKTTEGQTRVLASTHFEPTSARMAFPCFDEPNFKANYSVRIRRGPSHIALSNMPIEHTVELDNGLFEDRFEASVQMSTYLVAFIVCDFKSVSKRTVSIYAVPHKWHQTHYALEAAVKLLEFYETYFNIYYPLPKLDLIAIPDFQSGAMENWGLTTYRETSLLYDPDVSSTSDKLWVTMVIGHELAHQWFGNLVTMEWWNDIWLNEGFARYMEFVSVEATYPQLKVEDYLLDTCFAAIGRDSLNSSRAISCSVENPTQIKEMFDTVSYDKGACILHMLRHFLTDDVFQSGIVRYLRKFKYRNAKNEDLWDSLVNKHAMRDNEKLNLKKMMCTWTLQKGIPLVTVKRQGTKLYIEQERFLKTVQPSDPLWHSCGIYAVSFKDRANLIHNAFQLVTAGRLTLDQALDLITYLKSETHNVPLLQGLGYLESFYKMIEKRNIADITQNLKTYILQYFRDVIDKQTWSNEGTVSDRRLRSELLSLACDLGYTPCLEKAKHFYQTWVTSNGTISLPSDVTETIYMVGAQDENGWQYLLEKYGVSMSEAEKCKFLAALASSKDSSKLLRLLELGMEGSVIRTQDLSTLIYTVARNPAGHFLAWNFVKKNWNKLVEKFQLGSFSMRNIIIGTTAQFSSKEELANIKDFFDSVKDQSSQLRVTQVAVENVEKNILWLERNLETLRMWLQQRLN
uniref:Aminopeptidase n=1 Tax=Pygocentrus nattereri TaxID=42514 RepID=A0AAR2KT24_PYGNA